MESNPRDYYQSISTACALAFVRDSCIIAPMSDAAQFLDVIHASGPRVAEELLPLLYEELRSLAAHKMAKEVSGQTLQPTALVHEAWLRLSQNSRAEWQNRDQFYAVAAETMHRILVDATNKLPAKATNDPGRR